MYLAHRCAKDLGLWSHGAQCLLHLRRVSGSRPSSRNPTRPWPQVSRMAPCDHCWQWKALPLSTLRGSKACFQSLQESNPNLPRLCSAGHLCPNQSYSGHRACGFCLLRHAFAAGLHLWKTAAVGFEQCLFCRTLWVLLWLVATIGAKQGSPAHHREIHPPRF